MKKLLILLISITLCLTGCTGVTITTGSSPSSVSASESDGSLTSEDIPAYSGSPYVEINDNKPFFSSSDLTQEAFETYSDLDSLGRCGVAYANICTEIMPTEKRGDIGSVRPSGWHTVKYDSVDGKYLYNRCHLIGFQLAGENANEKNLITGTRYMNTQGMLPFENMVADYVKEEDTHVLYRVTPLFEGDELVARGVFIEAKSVEDKGESIEFNVFCYNVQPGITIDYSDGSSHLSGSGTSAENETEYIGNSNTMKFHRPSCPSVETIREGNKVEFTSRKAAVAAGYAACNRCKP